MAFMRPVAAHMAAYHVDTNHGTEIVPVDVCGELEEGDCAALAPYLEGTRILSVERKEGWYARLSAPGYLDCTGWDGPHETAEDALDAVKDFYEVDDNGDPDDGTDRGESED